MEMDLRPGSVLPQPIIPLFKPTGSPEASSRDSRPPPENRTLTWRNTKDSLEHLSLFTKSSLLPPLLFLKDYHKLQWVDPNLWKRATRVASRPLESTQPARSEEEEESRKVQKLNGLIGMAYTVSAVFRDRKDAGRHEDEAFKRKSMMAESWNFFAEMLTFMENIPKGDYSWVRSL